MVINTNMLSIPYFLANCSVRDTHTEIVELEEFKELTYCRPLALRKRL